MEYFAVVAQEISREPEGGRGKQALHWEVRALSPSSSSGSGGVQLSQCARLGEPLP